MRLAEWAARFRVVKGEDSGGRLYRECTMDVKIYGRLTNSVRVSVFRVLGLIMSRK